MWLELSEDILGLAKSSKQKRQKLFWFPSTAHQLRAQGRLEIPIKTCKKVAEAVSTSNKFHNKHPNMTNKVFLFGYQNHTKMQP